MQRFLEGSVYSKIYYLRVVLLIDSLLQPLPSQRVKVGLEDRDRVSRSSSQRKISQIYSLKVVKGRSLLFSVGRSLLKLRGNLIFIDIPCEGILQMEEEGTKLKLLRNSLAILVKL